MPTRRTPEQYARVAAAGWPPRHDDPRFTAGGEDSWHEAQASWHEQVRSAFGHDELPARGEERRKAWQAATKQAAAFLGKLAEDSSLSQPHVDDGLTPNERRAERRREQKAREHAERTEAERQELQQEMLEKPFNIRTLFAFGKEEDACCVCMRWPYGSLMTVLPDGTLCLTRNVETRYCEPTYCEAYHKQSSLVLASPEGALLNEFVVAGDINGLASNHEAIFVSGRCDGRGCVRKFGFDGSLLCSSTCELRGPGRLWIVDELVYVTNCCSNLVMLECTSLEYVGGFTNSTPREAREAARLWKDIRNGEDTCETILGLAACGDELFIASKPVGGHVFLPRGRINVFTRDGAFLRIVQLHGHSPNRNRMDPSILMSGWSATHGSVLVTFRGPPRPGREIGVHALDGSALHSIRFASEPYCSSVVEAAASMWAHANPIILSHGSATRTCTICLRQSSCTVCVLLTFCSKPSVK
jgi:hypothetical protein